MVFFEFVEFLVKIGEGRVFGNDLNQGVLHERKHKEICELFAQTIRFLFHFCTIKTYILLHTHYLMVKIC